jgi:putative DNA-invertase from lambdoid prophage Rac
MSDCMPRSFGLCRASDIKQVESTAVQCQLIQVACERLQRPHPTILEEPKATSGTIPFALRPQGSYLLRVLRKDDLLVVVRVDRLGRNMLDIYQTVQGLCDRGVRVIILRGWGGDSIDLGRATDRLFLMILAWMAETERNLTAERTKDALQYRRNNGLSAGKTAFHFIQAFNAAGEKIPNGEFSKMKGHFKRNLPDLTVLNQLVELLVLQKATKARGRLLFDYCREKGFVNHEGREWWRGTVHYNAKGCYMNNISKALKRVRRMAVLGQLPEEWNLRVLAITGDTQASVRKKWTRKVQSSGESIAR